MLRKLNCHAQMKNIPGVIEAFTTAGVWMISRPRWRNGPWLQDKITAAVADLNTILTQYQGARAGGSFAVESFNP
jgi:hypothetical protein